MTKLSPAAQEVVNAYTSTPIENGAKPALAAALRAAADQVAPWDFDSDSGRLDDGALEFEAGQDCRNEAIRLELFAIADELEAQ